MTTATTDTLQRVIRIPYKPRLFQRQVHTLAKGKRFGVLVCHRRFGKTVLAVNHLLRGALTCTKSRPRFGYIAPTYTQGKSTSWDYFRHYATPIPDHAVNQSELRIDLPNGGQVRIYGADNPDSLRGLYFDGVVLDEYGLHPPKTFSEVIGPTLVDRGGSALFLGTPNGKNQFYDIAHARPHDARDPDWFFRRIQGQRHRPARCGYLAAARAVMTARRVCPRVRVQLRGEREGRHLRHASSRRSAATAASPTCRWTRRSRSTPIGTSASATPCASGSGRPSRAPARCG